MKKDTRGLSAVVTTLIVLLLVLVAVGIVWVVVKDLITGTSDQIGTLADCPLIDLEIVATNGCDSVQCNVSVKRNAGGPEIGGVRVVVTDGVTSGSNETITLGVGETKQATITPSPSWAGSPSEASAVAYFSDEDDNPQYCNNIAEANLPIV